MTLPLSLEMFISSNNRYDTFDSLSHPGTTKSNLRFHSKAFNSKAYTHTMTWFLFPKSPKKINISYNTLLKIYVNYTCVL